MSGAEDCDLLVVGGGINGAGIARDAAGRGLSVQLVERDDLAGHTSSASTKLIHGGLRYLEQYELRLVREALAERERLLRIAPHIIRPLRFVLPYVEGMRPRWLLRLGLFVYDHLERRERLAASRELDLQDNADHAALQAQFARGFEYSDCWVEDSRLTVLNARDAAERGAQIHVRTRLESAGVEGGVWVARCIEASGATLTLRARALVNATGTWVNEVVRRCGLAPRSAVRLVKGSHLVFPRLYAGTQAYLLQNPDRRVVFLIPYERDFTLVGTTDVPFEGDASAPQISEAETRYLCDCVNAFLKVAVSPAEVLSSYSGVRPLHDDGSGGEAQKVSRDYRLELQAEAGAPLLSVYGGKITTYRKLAEHAMDLLLPALGRERGDPWTALAPLPGGDIADGDLARFTRDSQQRWSGVDPELIERLARSYGTRLALIVGGARSTADLGRDYGLGLTQRELDHLVQQEWARSPEDVLRRRTRLGLRDADGAVARTLRDYFSTNARSIT